MSYQKLKDETYNINGGINTKVSKYTTERNELLNLRNMHFLTLDAVTKRPGTSLYLGATVGGRIGGLYEFEKLDGSSYVIATANTNAYTVTSTYTSFRSGLLNNGIFDFVTFVDRLFMANGQDFFKYDGTNTSAYSLPPGQSTSSYGITGGYTGTAGLSGIYIAGYGYLNNAGYYGPVSEGLTVSLNGISYNCLLYYGMTTPQGFGISGYALYRSEAGFLTMFGTTTITGASFVDQSHLSTRSEPPYQHFTLAPKYLEIFNNQLILAGFSSMQSTFYWSDIAEPEGVRPESFAEVRTNDGDRITGTRAYQGELIVTKQYSLHRLSGDNPDNFVLQEITDQYGCLSNRTLTVFNDLLVFLDSKGIVKFNGANIEVISARVEPFINRINVAAAIDNATAIHNRKENEVWFCVPVDGSSINNAILVYDYLADAWTIYDGLRVSSLNVVQGALEADSVLYGGYTGSISFFDDDIESDNGAAFTCTIQTRFVSVLGQSVEEQFRRFYLNLDPILGITQGINVNFYSNYGLTAVATFTMYQNPFQSRIDFGIPAKVLSAEIVHSSASLSFKVFGWTVESRYQRAT